MSGQRDDALLLDDAIKATRRLIELGQESELGMVGGDQDQADMIQWNLVVLGEAAKRVCASTRDKFPDVPWRQMSRTRDRIAHHYEGVDWVVVAQVIHNELPALLPRLIEIRDTLRAEFDAG